MNIKEVKEFCKKHPIYTNGAINSYEISIETVNDGDVLHIVTLPVWWQNQSVLHGILLFLEDAITYGFYKAENDNIKMFFIESLCDPD